MKKKYIILLLLVCSLFLFGCQPKSQCEIEGHDIQNHEGKEATCTEDGYDAYETCSRCDYTTLSVIPALGHDYIYFEGKEATCQNSGYYPYHKCNRCDLLDVVWIPKLQHNFIDYKCSYCNKDYASYLKIGTTTNDKVSNDNVGYNFYMSQKDTGAYSDMNCGPTCTYMACKWANESFSASVEDIRNINVNPTGNPNDHGWYPETIIEALRVYNFNCKLISIDKKAQAYDDFEIVKIKDEIISGNLLIICFNCKDIKSDIMNKGVTGQVYGGGNSGHFVLIKGYLEVDNKLYFEIYDPALPLDYNNVILGSNRTRYYDAIQLVASAYQWNNSVVVVSK